MRHIKKLESMIKRVGSDILYSDTQSTLKEYLGDFYEDLLLDQHTQFEDNEEDPNDPFVEFSVKLFLDLYYIKERQKKFRNLL